MNKKLWEIIIVNIIYYVLGKILSFFYIYIFLNFYNFLRKILLLLCFFIDEEIVVGNNG